MYIHIYTHVYVLCLYYHVITLYKLNVHGPEMVSLIESVLPL